MNLRYRHPRKQAERLAGLLSREGAQFRGAILGRRREGKTDLLQQVQAELFTRADGPVPFLYTFDARWGGGAQDPVQAALARHCFASFCQQVRAFLMRQEELLGEPVALLERELERPGIPLSLTELAQNFLSLPPEQQLRFVAGLPGQLAYLERRPVCWLLDEVQELGEDSPVFAALEGQGYSWLLSGRYPFLRRLAGEAAWPVVPLEPFSLEETLALTGRLCREAEVSFVPEAWETWLGAVGNSPGLVQSILDAAASQGEPLETLEELGRVYTRELAAGTTGNWLASRFEAALPERQDRLTVARFLNGLAGTGSADSTPLLPPRMWNGLVAEEWADETPLGPRWRLETVQWDWLWLATASLTAGAHRAQARALQALLARAELDWKSRETAPLLASIRQRLRELPLRGFPPLGEPEAGTVEPPDVCSVSYEQSGTAELFWCYGFHGSRRDVPEAACVLLIVLCAEEPAPAEIETWRRELRKEERLLPGDAAGRSIQANSFGVRGELWLVLPAFALLKPGGSERRFSFEAFAQWLETGKRKKF